MRQKWIQNSPIASFFKQNQKYRVFFQDLASVILARTLILGPVERMKIIMQTKDIAKFVNPKDYPKNSFDLI